MGFDAIWISPIVSNIENQTADGGPYHGCAASGFFFLFFHISFELVLRKILESGYHHTQQSLRGREYRTQNAWLAYFELQLTQRQLMGLSKALHDRNMYLLLDVVINHMAASTLPTPFNAYTPFNQPADYHPFCFITDYNNQVRHMSLQH